MDWSSVKSAIGKFAPWIAGAIGTPAAGAAVGALCGALGLNSTDAKPDDVAALINRGQVSADQLLALKKADQEFQLQMKQLDINDLETLEKMSVEDRKSARDRQIQIKDVTPQILAYLALAVWGTMNGFLLYMAYRGRSLPTDMSPIIMRVLGTMDALMGMAFAFFFGTSASSRSKDQMLYNSTPLDQK